MRINLAIAYKLIRELGAVIAVEVEMMARIFWILGAGLTVLAMLLMAYGGPEAGGIVDYRAWLLLAFGILAMTIGNFSRTSERGS